MNRRIILETARFKKEVEELGAQKQIAELSDLLRDRPDYGKVVPATGGLRKVRMGLPGRGKRGGARIIYYDMTQVETVVLLACTQRMSKKI